MNKHTKNNIKEWWYDKRWKAKHGEYDWTLPIVAAAVVVLCIYFLNPVGVWHAR